MDNVVATETKVDEAVELINSKLKLFAVSIKTLKQQKSGLIKIGEQQRQRIEELERKVSELKDIITVRDSHIIDIQRAMTELHARVQELEHNIEELTDLEITHDDIYLFRGFTAAAEHLTESLRAFQSRKEKEING